MRLKSAETNTKLCTRAVLEPQYIESSLRITVGAYRPCTSVVLGSRYRDMCKSRPPLYEVKVPTQETFADIGDAAAYSLRRFDPGEK